MQKNRHITVLFKFSRSARGHLNLTKFVNTKFFQNIGLLIFIFFLYEFILELIKKFFELEIKNKILSSILFEIVLISKVNKVHYLIKILQIIDAVSSK